MRFRIKGECMQRMFWGLLIGTILLSGCGGYAPLHRAHDVLFDMPYIAQQQKEDELTLGMKRLSIPEVHEIFCRADQLLEKYQVFYLRAHNVGQQTYFLHILNAQLPVLADIQEFFDPYTAINTVGHVLLMIPVGVGIAAVAPDALISFLGFLGISMGAHVAESYILGAAGYEKLAKHAVVKDPDRGTPGLAVLPYRHEHYFLFMPRRDPNAQQIAISIARKGAMTREITFDMSAPLTTTGEL
jgi:hypothetical protein